MKKLTLALVLVLGAANVNAMIPAMETEVSDQADLDARIRSSNFDEAEKATVLAWVKEHKVITAAVSAALLIGTAALVDKFAFDSKYAGICCTVTKNTYKDTAAWTTKTAKKAGEHYVITSAAVLGLVAAILSVYDLSKGADRSALIKLYNSLVAKCQSTTEAVAEEVGAIEEAVIEEVTAVEEANAPA